MIARESFEKSWPRFLSAAPFLCLIEDHLLCPDIALRFYQLEEELVDARVVGELGMEGCDQEPSLSRQHGMTVVLREHLDLGTGVLDPRRADEDAAHRRVVAGELEVGLERMNLSAPRVALHRQVEEPEVVA